MDNKSLRIGIDIGGTFTDFVVFSNDQSQIKTFKILSTPSDPAQAVLQGLEILGIPKTDADTPVRIIHGSTVATNALLEHKGAKTALITTLGFADILQIGRQNRPSLYDFKQVQPEPLIPPNFRFEVDERITANGEILKPLDPDEINILIPKIDSQKIESVAVSLLFSFIHPGHEAIIAAELRKAGYFVSVSSEILPEYREYERTSTTAINAYVSPVLDRYLSRLDQHLQAQKQSLKFHVMQSNGGVISIQEARNFGVRCILSGPAGGVVGSQFIGESANHGDQPLKLITFDMGGTSTDVALIDQEPMITTESTIGGLPLGIPVLDIHTIGSGGGSIAYIDPGGALRVGPESAGADPGPACYGKYDPEKDPVLIFPTVTDANLLLGRIMPDNFLGGKMPLFTDRSNLAVNKLCVETGLSIAEIALGIIAVANTHMERALRVISVERGHDPRDFTLLSFGGAGGLHAVDLARKLSISKVLIPPYASTLSALGMLAADTVKDYSKTVMLLGDIDLETINLNLSPLVDQAVKDLQAENIQNDLIDLEPSLDMRYQGQSYELTIPLKNGKEPIQEFHLAHEKAYGYFRSDIEPYQIEIVNIRLRAVGHVSRPQLPVFLAGGSDPSDALIEKRSVILESGNAEIIPFYASEALMPGYEILGPAVIVRSDTTVFLGKKDQVAVDEYQNLIVTVAG